jgi:hypothetical protein
MRLGVLACLCHITEHDSSPGFFTYCSSMHLTETAYLVPCCNKHARSTTNAYHVFSGGDVLELERVRPLNTGYEWSDMIPYLEQCSLQRDAH